MDLSEHFRSMVAEGYTLEQIIEGAIMYGARIAAEELSEAGHELSVDDAYDAILEGIRTSAEIAAAA
jgi:hypothetical protein